MKLRSTACFLIAALGSTPPLAAQVNVERLRRAPEQGFALELASLFTLRTGNTRLTQFDLRGRVDVASGPWSAFFVGSSDIGRANGRRFSNAALTHARVLRSVSGRAGVEAFAQMNYDVPRKLDWRFLGGGGARVSLWRRGSSGMWLGSALMIEHERLLLPDTAIHPRRTTNLRWSSYLSARVQREGGASFSATTYVQPWLADFADLRVLLEATLSAPLSRRADLAISARMRYDGRPPDGVHRLDAELRQGIALSF